MIRDLERGSAAVGVPPPPVVALPLSRPRTGPDALAWARDVVDRAYAGDVDRDALIRAANVFLDHDDEPGLCLAQLALAFLTD